VDDASQAKIGNVKLEPESAGQRSRVEDARGIDCLESRYAQALFPGLPSPCFSLGGDSSHIDG
jgi:hypothetical protein